MNKQIMVSLAVALLALTPIAASAQPAQPAPPAQPAQPKAEGPKGTQEEALMHFQRGLELYQEQDFSGALIEFRRAYEIAPTYKMLYNIGQVCYQLADYSCSSRSFDSYLREGGTSITSERRAEVDKELQKLSTRIGRVEVVTNVPGVEVTIDDVYVGKTPLPAPVAVSAGQRKITAVKDGHVPVTRIISVAGTDSMRLELVLPSTTVTAAPVVVRESRWNTISWIGLGATVALGATAGVTGGLALGASNEVETTRFTGAAPPSSMASDSSSVNTLSTISDVCLAASIVTLSATLIYTLAHEPKVIETEKSKDAKSKDEEKKSGAWASVSPFGVMGGF